MFSNNPSPSFPQPQQQRNPSTFNRDEKIHSLKKKIIKMYGSNLINFLSYQTPVPVIYREDSPEIRQEKLLVIQEIVKEREEEYLLREGELFEELEKIISRIRNKLSSASSQIDYAYQLITASNDPLQKIFCYKCGNKDINNTIVDPVRGDRTCNGPDNEGCGEVIQDSIVFNGAEKRNFEGEEDRNHHGPTPNKLMPDVVNLETHIFVGNPQGKSSAEWKRLSHVSQNVEMNLSKIRNDDKHTREGYKTRMKREACALLEEISGNLNIATQVTLKAKEIFAKYRDLKEAVHNYEGTVAACLVIAYEDLSMEMNLEEINKTYVISSDISSLANSNFGNLPSYEDVKDDIAICTVPNINIGKFTLDQVKIWIEAIANAGNQQKISKHKPTIAQIYIDFHFYGNLLLQYITEEYEKEKKLQLSQSQQLDAMEMTTNSQSSTPLNTNEPTSTATAAAAQQKAKRKFSETNNFDGLFGRTTISNRLQNFKKPRHDSTSSATSNPETKDSQQAASSEELSELANFPGKLLLKILPKEIIRSKLTASSPVPTTSGGMGHSMMTTYDENDLKIVNDYFQQAIHRRSSYDKLMMGKQHRKRLEMKRLKIEESNAIPLRKKMIEDRNSHQNGHHHHPSIVTENESKENENEPQITFIDELDLDDIVSGPVTVKPATPHHKPQHPNSTTPKSQTKPTLAATIGKAPPSAKNQIIKPESSKSGALSSSPAGNTKTPIAVKLEGTAASEIKLESDSQSKTANASGAKSRRKYVIN